jgi:hypothetical protein
MQAIALDFDKEILRNLAGPELVLQTGFEPLETAGLADVNGGSLLSAVVSAVGSAIGSALVSALSSAVSSAVVSSPASAATSAAASAVGSAAGSAVGSGIASFAYNKDPWSFD